MSNYLQGLSQAVGFARDNKDMDMPPAPRDNKWDMVSHHSRSKGAVNLLYQARGNQTRGGDHGTNETYNYNAPTQWEWQHQGGGRTTRAINKSRRWMTAWQCSARKKEK